jgi:hypothetical protein
MNNDTLVTTVPNIVKLATLSTGMTDKNTNYQTDQTNNQTDHTNCTYAKCVCFAAIKDQEKTHCNSDILSGVLNYGLNMFVYFTQICMV